MKKAATKTVKENAVAVASVPTITDDDLLAPGPTPEGIEAPAPVQSVTGQAQSGAYLSPDAIAEIVRAAVQGVTAASSAATGEAIARALTQHMGPRRMTVAEVGEPKTPFNPRGIKRELDKEYFQNYAPIQERYVSDGEIEMLRQITPGKYGTEDFPIAVVEKTRINGKTRCYIVHPDGKDDRFRSKNYAPNFYAMLVRLVQEAKEQKAQRRADARALLAED